MLEQHLDEIHQVRAVRAPLGDLYRGNTIPFTDLISERVREFKLRLHGTNLTEADSGGCQAPAVDCEAASGQLEIGCLRTTRIRLNVERHPLSFCERTQTGRLKRRCMYKYVFSAAIWRDEAETL